MKFDPHGSHELAIEGRILVMRTRGPWNAEQVAAYARDQQEKAAELAGRPWALLAFVSGIGLHTADAIDAMVEIVTAQRRTGRCGSALIIAPDAEAPIIVEERFRWIYGLAGEPCAFFDDEDSARRWLAERLAEAERPSSTSRRDFPDQ